MTGAAGITVTIDLEDHRPDRSVPRRYPALTRGILDRLDELGIRTTVFVVGAIAEEDPDLVREVAERGHEIGLHNWRHEHLTTLDRSTFREWVRRGKQVLEDLTGRPVVGFRAPTGSLVAETVWAVDVLAEEGYRYSSSVCSAPNPLFWFPHLPAVPFRWDSGLAEFPAPTLRAGPFRFPFGGTFVRAVPTPVLERALRRRTEAGAAVLYVHPYDFDPGEPFWWVPDAGWMSPLLWVGRARLAEKAEHLVGRLGVTGSLGERLDEALAGPLVAADVAAARAGVPMVDPGRRSGSSATR